MNVDTGKRYLQFILLVVQFLTMGISLWPACWFVMHFSSLASKSLHWVLLIMTAFLIFNYVYLIVILILRILLPKPIEGYYAINPVGGMRRETVIFMFNALLTILRYRSPWAAYISSLLVNIFPMHYFYSRIFGPNTSSTTLGDTYICYDPCLLKAGKNVQFGGSCTLICHHYDNKGLFIKHIEIGDNSVIGGHAIIMAGVKIGCNSVIGNASRVAPNTIIGDYEFWAGNPATKRKDLPREERVALDSD